MFPIKIWISKQASQSSKPKSWLTRSKQARTRRSWLNGVRSSGLKTELYNSPRKLSNQSLLICSHKLHDVHCIRVLGSFCQSDECISSKVRWRGNPYRVPSRSYLGHNIRGKEANWQCLNASMNTYEGARNEMAEAKTKWQGNDYVLWAKISSVLHHVGIYVAQTLNT